MAEEFALDYHAESSGDLLKVLVYDLNNQRQTRRRSEGLLVRLSTILEEHLMRKAFGGLFLNSHALNTFYSKR